MQARSKKIRLTPTTKECLEEFREREFDSYAPLGEAVQRLLDEVSTDE